MVEFKKTLFIFRRDLRIADNTALIAASKSSAQVIPCFIFDPKITKDLAKKSKFRFRFLIESIIDLQKQINRVGGRLQIYHEKPINVISRLKKEHGIEAVFVNADYSKYSKSRDKKIKNFCAKNKISFNSFGDITLQNFENIKTQDGNPYKVFTQFFKKAKTFPVRKPQNFSFKNLSASKSSQEISINKILNQIPKTDSKIKGGTTEAQKILKNLKELKNYDNDRNFPFLDATTHLSAHNKFGTCSIREIYHKIVAELGKNHTLISELYWRDFFMSILFYYPYSFDSSFRKKYSKFPWSRDKKSFKKWCEGMTGFPIVDAGMRQLNATGYMHNRVRMIVASFLTKDLHIDWKWGERYFAEKLIDYDPSANVGNWQWASSTGCDAQPWFRIFNPWLQQKKFDSDCRYIRVWVPELEKFTNKEIHSWFNRKKMDGKYPLQIVDHKEESTHTKELFSRF